MKDRMQKVVQDGYKAAKVSVSLINPVASNLSLQWKKPEKTVGVYCFGSGVIC